MSVIEERRIKSPPEQIPPPRNKSPLFLQGRIKSPPPGINPPGLNPPFPIIRHTNFKTLFLIKCSYLKRKCTKHWSIYFQTIYFHPTPRGAAKTPTHLFFISSIL